METLIIYALLLLPAIIFYSKAKQAEKQLDELGDFDELMAKKKAELDELTASKTEELNSAIAQKTAELNELIEKKTAEVNELKASIKQLRAEEFLESVTIEAYQNLKSDEVKNELALLAKKQATMEKNGKALTSIATKRELSTSELNNQKKQILRCFNAESSNLIESVTYKNVDSIRSKLNKSYENINRLFKNDGVQISGSFLASKLEELSLVYAYMVKEQEERETRKAIREQMVEEEKVRREIERAKQKLEKDELQYRNEVNKLMLYMQQAKDEVQSKLYADKIAELEVKIKEVESEKENVLDREKNARAGFVYIISNIGSFGEKVFKIGMTRRLEPMDRIAELSSASVPFPFDVHAMIFTEDAPALEGMLHDHFNDNRINKVNTRKEFFKVDLEEIKKLVQEKHNATTKFIDIPEAEEYRETLRIEENA